MNRLYSNKCGIGNVAVEPVVLRGSRPPGASWSTVSSMMARGPLTSLTGPPRVVEFSQRPINSRSNPNVSAAFLTLALQPARTMRISAVNLPAPPLPPHHSQPVYRPDQPLPSELDLSLSAPFQQDDVEKFSLIRLFRIPPLRFP